MSRASAVQYAPYSNPQPSRAFPIAVMTSERDAEPPPSAELLAELDRLRLSSLLSGGLAHEVANPLIALLGSLDEMKRVVPMLRATGAGARERALFEALESCVEEAQAGADAIAAVVRDFQVFLRPNARAAEPIDPAECIERAIRMAYPQIKAVARLRLSITATPNVAAPPSFLTQVALNLLVNACEALGPLDPQRNRIEVRLAAEDRAVVLEISDNGPGLDPLTAAKVFEPHYTRKPRQGSLGLGLSICRALVERVGGSISVTSAPGERTSFRVELPSAGPAPFG
jgi:two-component system, NtrC family, sensor kinase